MSKKNPSKSKTKTEVKYPTSVLKRIPMGFYCHFPIVDGKVVKHCPYWSIKKNLPKHENGYCSLLKKSDWDLNEERGEMEWKNQKGKTVKISKPHEIPFSMLWDEIKMCYLKEFTDKELDEQVKNGTL